MGFLDMWRGKWLVTESNNIIKWMTISILLLATIYLIVLSIINKDLVYPRKYPGLFTAETLLFSFGSGSIIFLMAYGRGVLNTMTIVEFLLVSLKFGILQILLQFSGFYSYLFDYDISSSYTVTTKKN